MSRSLHDFTCTSQGEYVRGNVHTVTAKGLHSLFKRETKLATIAKQNTKIAMLPRASKKSRKSG